MASPDYEVERIGASAPADSEKPCLSFRFHAPGGARRQIDSFEREVRIRDQQRSCSLTRIGVTRMPAGPAFATAIAFSI